MLTFGTDALILFIYYHMLEHGVFMWLYIFIFSRVIYGCFSWSQFFYTSTRIFWKMCSSVIYYHQTGYVIHVHFWNSTTLHIMWLHICVPMYLPWAGWSSKNTSHRDRNSRFKSSSMNCSETIHYLTLYLGVFVCFESDVGVYSFFFMVWFVLARTVWEWDRSARCI